MNSTSSLRGFENKRLNHIDVAKGLGIILTVIGHTLVFSGFVETKAFATIYAFHMPFFFFLSGYLYKRKAATAYLSGKVKSLLFPFLLYQSLNIVLYFITWCIRRTIFYDKIKFGGFWFILTLLFISVMHYIIDTIISRSKVKESIKIILLMVIGFAFLGFGLIYSKSISDQPNQPIATAFVGYFFYELGFVYKTAVSKIRTNTQNGGRVCALIIGMGLLTLLYFTSKINICTVDMNTSRYGISYIFVFQALMGIAGLYLVSWAIQKNRIIQFFGRNSLVILLIHIPISKSLPTICRFFALSNIVTFMINTVLSIAISAFAVWLFNKYIPIFTGRFNWELSGDKI